MAVLVKFQKDWADEFEVHGFKIYNTLADWHIEAGSLDEHSYMFGTNEGWEEGDFSAQDFMVTEISKEVAQAIRITLGNSWGIFPFY